MFIDTARIRQLAQDIHAARTQTNVAWAASNMAVPHVSAGFKASDGWDCGLYQACDNFVTCWLEDKGVFEEALGSIKDFMEAYAQAYDDVEAAQVFPQK